MKEKLSPEITLYGLGYVGRAIFNFLKDKYQVQIVDPKPAGPLPEEIRKLIVTPGKQKPTVYAVVAVPTLPKKDGSCDTSLVELVIKNSEHKHYLIKSTVVPGTTESLIKKTGKKIIFSPEFIGEGGYFIPHWKGYPHPTDMKLHEFHIFGSERAETKIWVGLWQKVAGWAPHYAQTDSVTAEIIKYAENSHLATLKMFWDELYDLCKIEKRDYNEVRELLLLDGRISRAMSLIYKDARGFGGKCLPKDLNAIVRHMEKRGINPHFFKAILQSNKIFRGKSQKQ
ncbi:MAG: hypothetical protein A3D52_02235 [Candidatus Taylorbacteria bacterium RIFCSPHIGHO2_02_FULL_44_36]|uniref:UDP-glucose/GDP-mannose dehydrogenase dimerisation domain-containing protein n=1 Tax=Candidatus Taylorbacteria bacterium RIFCSPLOWO2_12_FULL_44_15c TaxID=1802333 RepID=A0A1G2P9S2_9BACT|nr:MAG: hypothetical protein A3D52_02235 [Candidatus Taylorbacteria bacterium RIFCSPHIGHO2_02_FULL_44_36]OHA38216.1 MAG: hypothetical protein A3I97_02175 [Candidatus Taylorbacteria bacterium RIFCSPLOWO2_02_FULL_44_35]OHA44402.1 MAG: hypothetical protein A3G03_01560 [Candidatus Taylorbacteria bacterium RIFCSPLOWO2_12_FULL_44_15c]